MFYDQTAIDYLIDRLGWAEPIPPTSLVIDSRNTLSNSGRYFDEFNKMVTVENVWSTINNATVQQADYNYYLYKLKQETVLFALSVIFDNNERAYYGYCGTNRKDISGVDYSGIIPTKGGLFDNLIGYCMSCKALELFLTTNRKNGDERGNKFNYSNIQTELNGIKNEYGKTMTIGLYALKSMAAEKVIDILWPTNKNRPILTGRRVW
jgi:hypothetical protein